VKLEVGCWMLEVKNISIKEAITIKNLRNDECDWNDRVIVKKIEWWRPLLVGGPFNFYYNH
jgi:hypothetical protein